jgi:hypothetical protein
MIFGCGSRKVVVRTAEVVGTTAATSADTLIHERIETAVEPVPEARATVSAAIEDIKRLPEVAVITARNNRAQVVIKYLHDTVTVTAICDSLQRLITNYELREKSYINTVEYQKKEINTYEKEQQKNSVLFALKYLLTGVAAGAVITLLFTKKSLLNGVTDFIKKIFKK